MQYPLDSFYLSLINVYSHIFQIWGIYFLNDLTE